jgi:hypothetical protein
MKKSVTPKTKITLTRETLHRLATNDLRMVTGAYLWPTFVGTCRCSLNVC